MAHTHVAFALPLVFFALQASSLLVVNSLRWWQRFSRGKSPFAQPGQPFDVFVSYRSSYADDARRLTDALIGLGLRPWFAEYIILLFARDRFDDAIRDGIRSSRFGVLLTSNEYFTSQHCLAELQMLFDPAVLGGEKLVEIARPQHRTLREWLRDVESGRVVPPLASSWPVDEAGKVQTFMYDAESDEWVQQLLRHLSLNPPQSQKPTPHVVIPAARVTGNVQGWSFAFTLSGWSVRDRSQVAGAVTELFSANDPHFRATFRVFESPRMPDLGPGYRIGASDDRMAYDEVRDLALLRLSRVASECSGLHLVHANIDGLGGRVILGLTHWGGRTWYRRFIVPLSESGIYDGTVQALEILFTLDGRFHELAQVAHIFESILKTLRVERRADDVTPQFLPEQSQDEKLAACIRRAEAQHAGSDEVYQAAQVAFCIMDEFGVDNARAVREALSRLDRAVYIDPGCAPAWNEQAFILGRVKRYTEALASVQRAISLQPNEIKFRNNKCGITFRAALDQQDDASILRMLDELRPDIAWLEQQGAQYPAAYLSVAYFLAATGAGQSAWEGYLAVAAWTYGKRAYMGSGVPTSEERIARSMEQATMRCLALARAASMRRPRILDAPPRPGTC
jgi:tetratricopeptide (TPR) repeat protein